MLEERPETVIRVSSPIDRASYAVPSTPIVYLATISAQRPQLPGFDYWSFVEV